MVARIGLGVTETEITAVLMRGRTTSWSDIEPVIGADTPAALHRIIERIPLPWPKPRVHVTIGGGLGRVKTLRDLPPSCDAATVSRIIATSPSRFFIIPERPPLLTGVRQTKTGEVLVGAIDIATVEAVQTACRLVGLTVVRFVPGTISSEALTDDISTHQCASALGAILLPSRERAVLTARRSTGVDAGSKPRRLIVAGCIATTALLLSAVVPGFMAWRSMQDTKRELAILAPTRDRVVKAQRELSDAARALSTVATFERRRFSMTLLLVQLADVLPSDGAITALRSDTSGITVAVIAPRAGDLVRSLLNARGVSNVSMTGPVTRETINGTLMERGTVRFRLTADGTGRRVPLASRKVGQ